MRDKETGLTDKELSLADAYINCDFNAIPAWEHSKYSQNCTKTTKRINAYKILRKPHVLAYIKQLKQKNSEKVEILADITRQECIDNARWLVKYGRNNDKPTPFAQGNDQLCKIAGIYTENINQTDTQRQRELDEKQVQEAEAIARIRLREFKVG